MLLYANKQGESSQGSDQATPLQSFAGQSVNVLSDNREPCKCTQSVLLLLFLLSHACLLSLAWNVSESGLSIFSAEQDNVSV